MKPERDQIKVGDYVHVEDYFGLAFSGVVEKQVTPFAVSVNGIFVPHAFIDKIEYRPTGGIFD